MKSEAATTPMNKSTISPLRNDLDNEQINLFFDQGITNGNGLTNSNGLTNGNGMVNGNGVTDGNGFVNGNGLVNGNGIMDGSSESVNDGQNESFLGIHRSLFKSPAQKRFVEISAGIIVLLLITMSALVIVTTIETDGISVDGKFSDWDKIPAFSDPQDNSQNPNIDIIEVRMDRGKMYFSLYMHVTGGALEGWGSRGDLIRIFFDIDAQSETGYQINGIGADYLIEIFGINQEILSANYYEYFVNYRSTETRGQNDWNGWAPMFEVSAAANDNEFETQLWIDELGVSSGVEPRVLFQTSDPLGNQDFSPVISRDGAVEVNVVGTSQESLTHDQPNEFLTLSFTDRAETPTEITGISFVQDSTAVGGDIAKATLLYDDTIISQGTFDGNTLDFTGFAISTAEVNKLTLSLELAENAVAGHALSLRLSEVVTSSGVSYDTERVAAYIVEVPEDPTIDGLFGDWTSPVADATGDVENPNIDLSAYDSRDHLDSTFFYVQVEGSVLTREVTPSTRAITLPSHHENPDGDSEPTSGNQDESPLPVDTGEDAVYIFIDTMPEVGYQNESIPFLADRMIEIKGQGGRIYSARLMEFDGVRASDWSWNFVENVQASSGDSELETVFDGVVLKTYFHLVDWQENEDWSDAAIAPQPVNMIGMRSIDFDEGNTDEEFGFAFASGDFIGNSYADLVVGAPGYNSDDGCVYIFEGGADPFNTVPDIVITAYTDSAMRFGEAFAVGDFDDDGDDDLAIGAPEYGADDSPKVWGAVFIFYDGGTDGDDNDDADVKLYGGDNGNKPGERFGAALVKGDFDNADDEDDLAVGAPFDHTAVSDKQGSVYMYLNPTTSSVSADGSFTETDSKYDDGYLGFALANGDFNDETAVTNVIAVGVPGYDETNFDGRVHFIFWHPTSELFVDYKQLDPSSNIYGFGFSLAVGNFDGDTDVDDILIGAPYTGSDQGAAFIYHNAKEDDSTPDETFYEENTGELLGYSVATGNLEGSTGVDDAVIGAPGYSTDTGRVYVFYGTDPDMDDAPEFTWNGNSEGDLFGSAVHVALIDGDTNSDGPDVIVGAPGANGDDGESTIYQNYEDIPEFSTMAIPLMTGGIFAMITIIRRRRR